MTMDYKAAYQHWLDSPALSNEEWQELDAIAGNEEEIRDRFFAPLEFGTAGLRGIMGTGLNRMNIHVVRHTTQAFASVIREEGSDARTRGVIICYDCRIDSENFAREAASVMAANGIHVRIFDALRPTPELSFAIRHYGAVAGLNITASHNPRAYNGYKVYWSDGAQLAPERADAISRIMSEIDIFCGVHKMEFSDALSRGLIEFIGAETDELFLQNVLAQAINREVAPRVADKFKIVYTPFHGAGHMLVPEALARLGITRLYPVPEQMVIDGSFPTVESPNPEEPDGFYLGIKLAKQEGADLIIGTDPDSDRVGVMVRSSEGEFKTISGNQMGVLLLDYVIKARRAAGSLPVNAATVKTIVTTEMARVVAEKNGVHIAETFTGFKFIAEKIAEFERDNEYSFIFGYEESYGYMVGDFVRDKDAVTASMMIAEMAAHYFEQGMTLLEAMDSLYDEYGYFAEHTINLVMPGIDGLEKMKKLMARLREEPPAEIGGTPVEHMRDYLSGKIRVSGKGIVGDTEIVGSNVLYFVLGDGTSYIVRPSGTEPKIKVYIMTRGEDRLACAEKIERFSVYTESLR